MRASRAPSGHGSALAGQCPSLVSGRLRNLLCRQICQRKSARPQPKLLGIVDRVQILGGDRIVESRQVGETYAAA